MAARPERKKKYYLGAKILNSAMFVVLFLISCYCKGKVHTYWLMLPEWGQKAFENSLTDRIIGEKNGRVNEGKRAGKVFRAYES